MSEWGLHEITVTARRFKWLPRPTVTHTFAKRTSCSQAEAMAEAAEMYGGVATWVCKHERAAGSGGSE